MCSIAILFIFYPLCALFLFDCYIANSSHIPWIFPVLQKMQYNKMLCFSFYNTRDIYGEHSIYKNLPCIFWVQINACVVTNKMLLSLNKMFLNFKFLTVKFLCFCYPYSHRILHFILKMVLFFYWKPLSIELIILHVVSYSDAGFLLFLYIFVVRNTNLKISFCALKEILWNLLYEYQLERYFYLSLKSLLMSVNVNQ